MRDFITRSALTLGVLLALASCSSTALAPALPAATSDKLEATPVAALAKLSKAPDNFGWRIYRNGAILLPSDWHELAVITSDNGHPLYAYAASPEAFSADTMFEVGISIQVVLHCKQERGQSATEFSGQLVNNLQQSHGQFPFHLETPASSGETKTFNLQYSDGAGNGKRYTTHKYIVANDAADTVYIFTFVSPAESWEENWKNYGSVIFSKLSIFAAEK